MTVFLLSLLFCVAVIGPVFLLFKVVEQIATHLRDNPDATKSFIDNVFLPLFARRDRTRQVTLEVVDPVEWPEEPAGSEKPSSAA